MMLYINNHYYSFSQYLKEKFHRPIYKATIDAGFICPNMDGTKGTGGCTFCNNESFSPAFSIRKENIHEQLTINTQKIINMRKKKSVKEIGFIAFFQAFSGTYGPVELMREWYNEALSFPNVIGLSVATRCDCINQDVLNLFKDLTHQFKEVWVEIGIESTHQQTLDYVNRGHTYGEVIDAVQKLKKISHLKLCVHLIHGLPFETQSMMLESVALVNQLKPDAIKFHHLEIVRDTVMEKQYKNKDFSLQSMQEYFDILGKSLQILDPSIIIQRLFSVSPKKYLIAPIYDEINKPQNIFFNYLVHHNIVQGSHFKEPLFL